MIRSAIPALVALALGGCVPGLTGPPETPPPPPAAPGERLTLNADGLIVAEADPYSRRALRRADHDIQATTLARGVSLVAEPADGPPIYVSNLLTAALVRRFSGHMPVETAMAAPVVFLIRPVVSEDALTGEGRIVVDWLVRAEDGTPVGVVYAARRASGAMTGDDPWTAVSAADAEHIALQTAATLIENPKIRDAIDRAAVTAAIALTPTPQPRPRPRPAVNEIPRAAPDAAPNAAPAPSGRPIQ